MSYLGPWGRRRRVGYDVGTEADMSTNPIHAIAMSLHQECKRRIGSSGEPATGSYQRLVAPHVIHQITSELLANKIALDHLAVRISLLGEISCELDATTPLGQPVGHRSDAGCWHGEPLVPEQAEVGRPVGLLGIHARTRDRWLATAASRLEGFLEEIQVLGPPHNIQVLEHASRRAGGDPMHARALHDQAATLTLALEQARRTAADAERARRESEQAFERLQRSYRVVLAEVTRLREQESRDRSLALTAA